MARMAGSAQLTSQIALRVRRARAATDFTQDEVAADCGVSAAMISLIEAGKCIPSVPLLVKLARALGVRPGELLPD